MKVKCAKCGWSGKRDEMIIESDNSNSCPDCLSGNTYPIKEYNKHQKKLKAFEVLEMLKDQDDERNQYTKFA